MSAQPRVSVVCVAYNHERFIAEAIESALGQSYQNIDVIVLNDGSRDSTSHIAQRYARIRYIEQENAGINAAYNAALACCQGDLIAFLAADDAWMPTKLAAQVDLFTRHPQIGMVYTAATVVDADGQTIGPFQTRPCAPGEQIGERLLTTDNDICAPSVVVRRECIDRFGGLWGSPQLSDYLKWLEIACYYPAGFVGQPLTRYRRHGANLSGRGDRSTKYLLYQQGISELLRRHPDLVGRYGPAALRRCAQLRRRRAAITAIEGDPRAARLLFGEALRGGGSPAALLGVLSLTVAPRLTSAALRLAHQIVTRNSWHARERRRG